MLLVVDVISAVGLVTTGHLNIRDYVANVIRNGNKEKERLHEN